MPVKHKVVGSNPTLPADRKEIIMNRKRRALRLLTDGLRECVYAGIEIRVEGEIDRIIIVVPDVCIGNYGFQENPWEDRGNVLLPKGYAGSSPLCRSFCQVV